MALFGHALVGLGIGAATAEDVRSRPLRKSWLGCVVLLAYLSDLLECLARQLGWALPHGATASVAVTFLSCVVALAIMRWVCGERSQLTLAAAVVAVCSHLMLDLVDGGLPLWWPVSAREIGPDWLELSVPEPFDRLGQECLIFGPVVAVGVLVRFWRGQRRSAMVWAAITMIVVNMAALMLVSRLLAVVATAGLVLAAITADWLRTGWQVGWQLVPLGPVLVVAAFSMYAWHQSRLGWKLWKQHDYSGAIACYERSRRSSPFGESPSTLYAVARCHRRLGDEATAHRLYRRGLQEYPKCVWFALGLADLYLAADDPKLRRAREAFRLAEAAAARAASTPYAKRAARLLRQAREAVEKLEPAGDDPMVLTPNEKEEGRD